MRSKVKLRLHHDVAHLQLPTNAPAKLQLTTPYDSQDIAQIRYYRSLWQGYRSNQGHTMMLHTNNSPPISLPLINFLHLTVSEISSGQDFICQGHYGKVKSRSNHKLHTYTPTNVPTKYQLPTPYGFRDKIL